MSLVYVFAASAMEAEPVRKMATPGGPDSVLRCGVNDIVLIESGMGPKNARSKAEETLGLSSIPKPAAVLVIGLCGGLTASMVEGRVVAYDACISTETESPRLACSAPVTDSMVRLLASSNTPVGRVSGVTSSRIAINREERTALAELGADIVDMESYSILSVSAAAGVPAAVLRVVSDSVDRELPDLNRALSKSGGLDGRKALGVALRSPVATLRLLSANKRAMQQLTPALEIVLKAPCFG